MYHVSDKRKYDALINGFKSVQAKNRNLNLDWEQQCRIYALLHRKLVPFDIKDIKSWTPETFYTFLQTSKNNKILSPKWEYMMNKYLKDSSKKYELYTYMRIVNFAMNTSQRHLTKKKTDYMAKHVIKFILDALNKK